MTWNDQRKGWFGRTKPKPQSTQDTSSAIPHFPCFSLTSVASILNTSRQTVRFWMQAGKLEYFRDNIGDYYVMRDELVRFVSDYRYEKTVRLKKDEQT